MTWREDLRRVDFAGRKLIGASFRGVPFFVESSDHSGGRRIVVHQFPLRDKPFVEDLGKIAGAFRVEGYVIGDDYLAQKEALLVALEDTAGPGELVHPYYGVRRVVCGQLSVRETRADGGMAVFAIEFAEAPAQSLTPTEAVDNTAEVATAADAAIEATKAEFTERFDPTGLPAFALETAATALRLAAGGIGAKLAPVAGAAQEAAALAGQVRVLTDDAASLVRQPADLLDEFRAAIASLAAAVNSAPGALKDALVEAYGGDLGTAATGTTATRQRERANQLAITGALRRIMAIEAARLAPLATYDSIEAATASRDQVAALLEEQAAGAGDTAYPALVDLRSQVMRAVPGSAVFARVITVTRKQAIPSLLLAHQLYGSVDREADVIARNGIRHPGFVVGDLKVLSDGG